MFNWRKWLMLRVDEPAKVETPPVETPPVETPPVETPPVRTQDGATYLTEGKLFACSYCGGTDFYEGPSGGMSTNMLCANDQCRHKFNYTGVINRVDDLHSTWEKTRP